MTAICLHKWRSKLWPASLIIYPNTVATPTLFTQTLEKLAKIGPKRGSEERERERRDADAGMLSEISGSQS